MKRFVSTSGSRAILNPSIARTHSNHDRRRKILQTTAGWTTTPFHHRTRLSFLSTNAASTTTGTKSRVRSPSKRNVDGGRGRGADKSYDGLATRQRNGRRRNVPPHDLNRDRERTMAAARRRHKNAERAHVEGRVPISLNAIKRAVRKIGRSTNTPNPDTVIKNAAPLSTIQLQRDDKNGDREPSALSFFIF